MRETSVLLYPHACVTADFDMDGCSLRGRSRVARSCRVSARPFRHGLPSQTRSELFPKSRPPMAAARGHHGTHCKLIPYGTDGDPASTLQDSNQVRLPNDPGAQGRRGFAPLLAGPGWPSACRPTPASLPSAVANDVTECAKGFVYRLGIGKHFGNVGVKDHHDRVLGEPAGVFPANATGKVVFRQHLLGFAPRACPPHTLSVHVRLRVSR